MHPYLPQTKLLNFCKEHKIKLVAYSPLGKNPHSTHADSHPVSEFLIVIFNSDAALDILRLTRYSLQFT